MRRKKKRYFLSFWFQFRGIKTESLCIFVATYNKADTRKERKKNQCPALVNGAV